MCYPLRYYFRSFYPILYSTGRLIRPGLKYSKCTFSYSTESSVLWIVISTDNKSLFDPSTFVIRILSFFNIPKDTVRQNKIFNMLNRVMRSGRTYDPGQPPVAPKRRARIWPPKYSL
ncbi:hypothetical protein RSAG8_11163, partial [Rhizoctonia solani AG-8 WAC10335]